MILNFEKLSQNLNQTVQQHSFKFKDETNDTSVNNFIIFLIKIEQKYGKCEKQNKPR